MASEVSYLKKINCESVVQQVIRCLTEAMVNKELRPGDKLPTELELAESMGVGRNSVREALKILTYLGCWKSTGRKAHSWEKASQEV